MMFAVGDLVVYGGEGVCRVESIGPSGLRYDGGDKTYYHLAPLYRSGTVMTPVDTAVMMRPIIAPPNGACGSPRTFTTDWCCGATAASWRP